jgi:hypothetical protein
MTKPGRPRGSKTLLPPEKAEALARAKQMYLDYCPMHIIAERTGLGRGVLQYHATEDRPISWATERKERERSLVDAAFASKKPLLAELSQMTLTQIKRGLEHISKRTLPPNVDEMRRLSDIITAIDKIGRLEVGGPTSITQVQVAPMTVADVRKVIQADPLLSSLASSPLGLPSAETDAEFEDLSSVDPFPEPTAKKPLDPVDEELADL